LDRHAGYLAGDFATDVPVAALTPKKADSTAAGVGFRAECTHQQGSSCREQTQARLNLYPIAAPKRSPRGPLDSRGARATAAFVAVGKVLAPLDASARRTLAELARRDQASSTAAVERVRPSFGCRAPIRAALESVELIAMVLAKYR
jgi:hypothetical protein